jgi:toxin ParE1/3/4
MRREVLSWRIDIAFLAQADLRGILDWTGREFGAAQRRRYRSIILAALNRLRGGPEVPGSQLVGPVRPSLRRLRVGPRARHVLIYRAEPGRRVIMLRILHDGMDLPRHLPPDES